MRTHISRVLNDAAIVSLLAVAHLVVGVAEEKFSIRAKMTGKGKSTANLPVFFEANGQQTQVATTGADGDFELAMDPDKNKKEFGIYRDDCNKDNRKLVIRARDPQEKKDCSELIGWFTWGTSATVGAGAGIGAAGWAAISGGVLVGTIAGVRAGGNTSTPPAVPAANNPSPTTFTLSSTLRLTGSVAQNGCPLIGAYVGTGTVTLTSSATGTFVVADPGGANRAYQISGTFAPILARVQPGGGHDLSLTFTSAPFTWTSGTGRNFSSQLINGTMSTNGTGTAIETHTYMSGGSAGPVPGCTDRINLSFAP